MSKSKINVPQARTALDQFKIEAAKEVGVNLKQGYNGDLTSKEAGSVGDQMVKNDCPVRTMKFTREYHWLDSHSKEITYEVMFAA